MREEEEEEDDEEERGRVRQEARYPVKDSLNHTYLIPVEIK